MPKTMLKKVEFSSSMYVGLEGSTKGKEINQQDVEDHACEHKHTDRVTHGAAPRDTRPPPGLPAAPRGGRACGLGDSVRPGPRRADRPADGARPSPGGAVSLPDPPRGTLPGAYRCRRSGTSVPLQGDT